MIDDSVPTRRVLPRDAATFGARRVLPRVAAPLESAHTPDTPQSLAACFAGGVALGCAGVSGFAFHLGDDGTGLMMAAFAFGLILLVCAVRP